MTHGAHAVARRRDYLDWLRGVAVLLMIEAHLLDSWTRLADRETGAFRAAMAIGGMGTVLFLLLAGTASALSAGSKTRRSGDPAKAARAVARRGLEIFALAFVFRLQAWILGWSSNPLDLLKVDILNIMGPSIVLAALLWYLGRSTVGRCVVFAAATLATALVTPIVRALPLARLPDPIEGYIVPVQGLSNFVFFPWLGMVFAGALAGVAIDAAKTAERERKVNGWLAAGGVVTATVAFAASYLPSPFSASYFWTSSPAYFFIRTGLVMCAIAGAYAWTRAAGVARWSPLIQLGRTSLFIYWIHVELLYGLISRPLHHKLSLPAACAAYLLFVPLMLACSIAKDRAVERYRQRQTNRELPV